MFIVCSLKVYYCYYIITITIFVVIVAVFSGSISKIIQNFPDSVGINNLLNVVYVTAGRTVRCCGELYWTRQSAAGQ